MNTFRLRFPWKEKNGTHEVETIELKARHVRSYYGQFRFEAENPLYPAANSRENARANAHSAASRVVFMDATGWRRSKSETVVWALCGRAIWPAGFDFTVIWRDLSRNRLAVTTEPIEKHLDLVEAECHARGWQFRTFAQGVGMRCPTLAGRLVLISPRSGVDIAPIIPTLERSLPCWEAVHA